MKRWVLVPVVLVTVFAATGCPGVGYSTPPSPTITSVVLSQDPVVAGSPFTVTVKATDDYAPVATVQLTISPVDDVPYPGVACDDPPFAPAAAVTQVFTCTLPDFVPNGTWKAVVYVDDNIPSGPEGLSNGAGSTVPFHLVGGSEDRQPPVLVSEEISPQPIVVGQPFTVTVQVSDDHLSFAPEDFTLENIQYQVPNPPPIVRWPCGQVTPTQLSPTLEQFDWTCRIGPPAALAWYDGFADVSDAYGHTLGISPPYVQVVQGP